MDFGPVGECANRPLAGRFGAFVILAYPPHLYLGNEPVVIHIYTARNLKAPGQDIGQLAAIVATKLNAFPKCPRRIDVERVATVAIEKRCVDYSAAPPFTGRTDPLLSVD